MFTCLLVSSALVSHGMPSNGFCIISSCYSWSVIGELTASNLQDLACKILSVQLLKSISHSIFNGFQLSQSQNLSYFMLYSKRKKIENQAKGLYSIVHGTAILIWDIRYIEYLAT